jgi:FtsP/CotA-like multicopper oxidase with cupredoxin domain
MTRNARIGFLLAAVAVLVIAFVVIGTGGDDNTDSTTTTAQPTATAQRDTAPSKNGQDEVTTPEPTPTEAPVQTIKVEGGEPVGGIQEIEVDKGDRVRFTVTSDAPEEVHTHGYDIAEVVGPNHPAEFDFKANVDGVYEVELEESAVQIAKLTVNP